MKRPIYITGDPVTAKDINVFCVKCDAARPDLPRKLREKYPEIEDANRRLIRFVGKDELYRTMRAVRANDGRIFCGLYSRCGNRRQTYESLADCLDYLADFAAENLNPSYSIGLSSLVGRGLSARQFERLVARLAGEIPQDVYIFEAGGVNGR